VNKQKEKVKAAKKSEKININVYYTLQSCPFPLFFSDVLIRKKGENGQLCHCFEKITMLKPQNLRNERLVFLTQTIMQWTISNRCSAVP